VSTEKGQSGRGRKYLDRKNGIEREIPDHHGRKREDEKEEPEREKDGMSRRGGGWETKRSTIKGESNGRGGREEKKEDGGSIGSTG